MGELTGEGSCDPVLVVQLSVLCSGRAERGPGLAFLPSNPPITSRIRKAGAANVGAAEELKVGQAGQAAALACHTGATQEAHGAAPGKEGVRRPETPFLKLYLLSQASGSRSERLHPCRPPPAINLMALSLKAA